MEVYHLFLVDHTLILYDATKEHMEYLGWAIMWFEAILGLKINMEKSELILISGSPIQKILLRF